MMKISKIFAIVASLAVATAAGGGLALAGTDSPFYPDKFKNPSLPYPSQGTGTGLPPQYW